MRCNLPWAADLFCTVWGQFVPLLCVKALVRCAAEISDELGEVKLFVLENTSI